MSDTMKRITLAVRINVCLTVDADMHGETVEVVNVVGISGLPSAIDVIEALEASGDFSQLDDEYEKATGEAV